MSVGENLEPAVGRVVALRHGSAWSRRHKRVAVKRLEGYVVIVVIAEIAPNIEKPSIQYPMKVNPSEDGGSDTSKNPPGMEETRGRAE